MRRDCADVLICVISELRLIASESINVPNNAIRRFFYPIKRLFTFGTHYKTKNVFIVNNIYDIIDKVNLRLKNVGRSVELGKKTEFGMTAWIQYRLRKG